MQDFTHGGDRTGDVEIGGRCPVRVPSIRPTPYHPDMSSKPVTDYAPPSRYELERWEQPRRARFSKVRLRHPEPGEHLVTLITWSAGDDDEHAWYWQATNNEGRTVAYGYMHAQDEDMVVKQCGESGADVAEDVEWRTEP